MTNRALLRAFMSSSANAVVVAVQSRPIGRIYIPPGEIFRKIKAALVNRNLEEVPVYDAETSGKRWLDSRVRHLVQKVLRHDSFRLYCDDNPVAPATSSAVLETIVKRYYIMDNDIARASLLMHRSGMFASSNGLLVEFKKQCTQAWPRCTEKRYTDHEEAGINLTSCTRRDHLRPGLSAACCTH